MASDLAKKFRIVRGDPQRIHPDDVSLIQDTNHPLYDSRVNLPLHADLVDSIRSNGTLQNIGLWRDGDVLWCVFGQQRTKACQHLLHEEGIQKDLRFEVRRGTTLEMLEWKMAENIARQEATISWRAEMAQRMISLGGSKESAMKSVGCGSVEALNLLLKVNDLDPVLKGMVDRKELSATFAEKELSSFPRDKMTADKQSEKTGEHVPTQMEVFNQLKEAGKISGERAVEAVRTIRNGKKASDAEPVQRMTSRKVLARWAVKLDKAETEEGKLARKIIRRILGHERALNGLGEIHKAYDEAIEPAPRKPRSREAEE